VAVCLKFLHTALEVFRSGSTEFYYTAMQRLTQRCEKCVENGGDFKENRLIFAKVV
jgi:hypothetical protein